MNIHIIDSVKGGAGKSTFACKLAISLLHNEIKPELMEDDSFNRSGNTSTGKKVCIIDVDLLGTSWEYTFENAFLEKEQTGVYSKIYLNDLIMDFKHYKKFSFVQKIEIKSIDGRDILDVIICNPSQPAKNRFVVSSETTVPDIQLDQFSNTISELLKLLEEIGYEDIIFDMPPNTDPYSDTIIKKYLKYPQSPQKYTTFLYFVSTLDIAHIKSTMEWYHNFLFAFLSMKTENKSRTLPEGICDSQEKSKWLNDNTHKLFVVLNDNYGLEDFSASFRQLNTFAMLNHQLNEDEMKEFAYLFIKYDNALSVSKIDMLTPEQKKGVTMMQNFKLEEFVTFEEIKQTNFITCN